MDRNPQQRCGCYHCGEIFPLSEVELFDHQSIRDAQCPYCGIDSLIPETSAPPLTPELLERMHSVFFEIFI